MATLIIERNKKAETEEGLLDHLRKKLKYLRCKATLVDDDGRVVGGVKRIVRGGRARWVHWG